MKIVSTFAHNEDMDVRYTCEGDDVAPPLTVSGVPEAKSLVLLVDDPDAPDPAAPKMVWDHWVLFNIPAGTTKITAETGVQGINSWGRNDYGGPCPPIGKHRYFFKLYALDTVLELASSVDKLAVELAMEGHIIAKAELIGLYQKK